MKNRGSGLTSVVLAIGAAVGVGVGGYFVLGGECSSCATETETAAAAALPVAGEVDSCCAAEGEATAELVSNTTEVAADACESEKATECAKATSECEGEMADCSMEGVKDCPMEGTPECPLENAEACDEEKVNEDT